ncbi:MAG TPA: twin-arginine translocase TatA/TatE family subunit [Abditibacteriaceae bacterium]|nr:twin-arginine translocase TatA/TatE family subunit [Abditibacteriaceae bacterium]
MFGLPGGSEWIIILLIVLVLFGGAKIPQMMRGMGQGIREFKKATKDEDTDETITEAESSSSRVNRVS